MDTIGWSQGVRNTQVPLYYIIISIIIRFMFVCRAMQAYSFYYLFIYSLRLKQ